MWTVIAAVLGALLLGALLLYGLGKLLKMREPYRTFATLRTREKLRFLRLLATDRRVPRGARVLLVLLAAYLASPVDLIPDFVPILGFLDDVAVVLVALYYIVRLTPLPLVEEIMEQSRNSDNCGDGADRSTGSPSRGCLSGDERVRGGLGARRLVDASRKVMEGCAESSKSRGR